MRAAVRMFDIDCCPTEDTPDTIQHTIKLTFIAQKSSEPRVQQCAKTRALINVKSIFRIKVVNGRINSLTCYQIKKMGFN